MWYRYLSLKPQREGGATPDGIPGVAVGPNQTAQQDKPNRSPTGTRPAESDFQAAATQPSKI